MVGTQHGMQTKTSDLLDLGCVDPASLCLAGDERETRQGMDRCQCSAMQPTDKESLP